MGRIGAVAGAVGIEFSLVHSLRLDSVAFPRVKRAERSSGRARERLASTGTPVVLSYLGKQHYI